MPRATPTTCPECVPYVVLKGLSKIGRHVASKTHQQTKASCRHNPAALERVTKWENDNNAAEALATYLRGEDSRAAQYENILLIYGLTGTNVAPPLRQVAAEDQLTDSHEYADLFTADPEHQSNQNSDVQMLDNDDASFFHDDAGLNLSGDDPEIDEDDDRQDEDGNDAEQDEDENEDAGEDEDGDEDNAGTDDDDADQVDANDDDNLLLQNLLLEQLAGQVAQSANRPTGDSERQQPPAFGDNEHFGQTGYYYPPPGSTRHQTRQPPDWYPFPSKLTALLYIFCNSPKTRFSRNQLSSVWWLVQQLNPDMNLPSIKSIMALRKRLPRPNIGQFYGTTSRRPYYQISLLDVIRMQYSLPGLPTLQETPEVVLAANGKEQVSELWHGLKWRHTPQLNNPMQRFWDGSNMRDIWMGDMVLVIGDPKLRYGIAFGRERLTKLGPQQSQHDWLQVLPLRVDSNRFLLTVKDGRPVVDSQTLVLLNGRQISNTRQITPDIPIFGVDIDTQNITPLAPAVLESLHSNHPIRRVHDAAKGSISIKVANLTLWNDGMSGVRGSRWNPYEVWNFSMAGSSHRTDSPFRKNIFLAAAQDVKAVEMIPSFVTELTRYQRGIRAYDASTSKTIFVCGGLVQGTGDNPAASEMCAHKWQSVYPCRVCLYQPGRVQDWEQICDSEGKLRTLAATKAGVNAAGMKELTKFYDLPGVNPHFDWAYDILHSAFLGYIKYLWIDHTFNHPIIKKHLERLALILDATSMDAFASAHRVGGRRAIRWKSLVGGDYKFLVQVMPICLIQMYRYSADWPSVQPLVQLWCSAAALTKLLCMHEIRDPDGWIAIFETHLRTLTHTWSDQYNVEAIRRKTKIHQLVHVPLWLRRFGPPIASITERNEAANKHIRGELALSNRQAGSKDLALRYASILGLQHMSQGGLWQIIDECDKPIMTCAGVEIINLFKRSESRQLLGLDETVSPSTNTNKVLKMMRMVSFGQLVPGSNTFDTATPFRSFSAFSLALTSTSATRGRGSVGSFVWLVDQQDLFRVRHIIQNDSTDPYLVLDLYPRLAPRLAHDTGLPKDILLFSKGTSNIPPTIH